MKRTPCFCRSFVLFRDSKFQTPFHTEKSPVFCHSYKKAACFPAFCPLSLVYFTRILRTETGAPFRRPEHVEEEKRKGGNDMERLSIKIKDQDNVVVAVHDLPAGTTLESGVVTREKIPQAHKIALVDIPPAARSSATAWCWAMQRTTSPPAAGSTSICWTCRKARH